jgi:hypothetical protein
MFHQCSARDVYLRGTLFMTRAFFSIVTVAAIARFLFVCPASIVVFGRGFRRRSAFSSFLLFKLREAKKKCRKNQKRKL